MKKGIEGAAGKGTDLAKLGIQGIQDTRGPGEFLGNSGDFLNPAYMSRR